ncbi:MAG: ComEC/Rec2 family competence protein [Ardenticatenales bacterium]|nr:ComEC/Rec2 family competence protein [Ardenticatenales bacterium]
MWLARTCTLWLIGIAAADGLWPPTERPPDVRLGGALVVLAVLVALSAGRRVRAVRVGAMAVAIVLAGAGRVWLARPRFDPGDIALWRDRGARSVEGIVAAEPERRDGGVHYVVKVERAAAARGDDGSAVPVHGLLLAQAARYPVFAYGDRVRVRGEIVAPPVLPGFDYRTFLARKGVHAIVRRAHVEGVDGRRGGYVVPRVLIAIKARAQRAVAISLPEPEASLATGILLGDDDGIPRRVADAFRRTNTTHVIAISGANIALLVAALQVWLGRWRRRGRAAGVTVAIVAAYALLVGADPAVVRAAIMGGLVVVALANDRRSEAVTALTLAGGLMTAWRPAIIGDLGFQLSFAATAGLVAFAGRLGSWVGARLEPRAGGEDGSGARVEGTRVERRYGAASARPPGRIMALLNESVLVTLAAQLTTWPLVAWHTGQLGAVGLVANVLVVPAQPAVMAAGGATIAAGLVAPGLGRLVGAVAWLPLAWTVRVVEACAMLPGAGLAWRPPLALVAGYYLALAVAAMPGEVRRLAGGVRDGLARLRTRLPFFAVDDAAGRSGTRPFRRRIGWPAFVLAGAGAVLAWRAVLAQPDGLLHVTALDVGQGDAILVVAPNGRRMLIDGGPSPSAVLDGLGRRFAPWDRRLDVVVLTHPDADHVGGLPAVLRRYRVDHIVQPAAEHATPDGRSWDAAVEGEGAVVHTAVAGMRLVLDGAAGVAAEVRWPPAGDIERALGVEEVAMNDRSVVLVLRHGRRRFVLTGDVEASVERALVRSAGGLRGDVLKVAHHGSATSSTPAFLAAVAPRLAVISVGADNRFGHPDGGVLGRLGGIAVRRTDVDGAVDVFTDGEGVWVR